MNDFEARRAARVERLRERANKKAGERDAAWEEEKRIGDRIPLGQPILIGHHSEKSHRATIRKLHRLADKQVRLRDEEAELRRRADAAEANRAIYADDPEALRKLRGKLERHEQMHERMKAANAAIRKHAKAGPYAQTTALVDLGFTEERARALLKPDFCGRIGFADYALRNNGAEIRRLKQRIEDEEARAGQETVTREDCGVEIVEDAEANRLRLFFPDKPSEALRHVLKRNGFRWAPSVGAWQRQLSESARYAAGRVLGEVLEAAGEADAPEEARP